MSDLYKVGWINVHWDYLVIKMSILLLVSWLLLLCSYPLELGRFRMFDGLAGIQVRKLYISTAMLNKVGPNKTGIAVSFRYTLDSKCVWLGI
jgi:hypothetical protein